MAGKTISYDRAHNRFIVGGDLLRIEQLGRLIANAYMSATPTINLCERVEVTREYVIEMLRFTAKHGWFWDCWEERLAESDHAWDMTKPTPGSQWTKANALLKEAAELRQGAHLARTLAHLDSEAELAEKEAQALEAQAGELLRG